MMIFILAATTLLLLGSIIIPTSDYIGIGTAYAVTTSDIEVGQYVQYGRYHNQPILWRVINVNDDGSLMLLSEKILALKPFDANGDLNEGDPGRFNFGSNNWETSNLREWLNSENLMVQYTHQPPDKDHVFNGFNAYENEPGFLYNFTQAERDAIQPVTHKSILSSADSDTNEGGTELYSFNSSVENAVQNFDNAFYKNLTDRVFLLDVKELNNYVFQRGYEHRRRPTVAAAAYSDYNINSANYWYYWLRTPETSTAFSSLFICYEGIVNFDSSFNGDHGVLPALNLKAGITVVGGNGNEGSPYIITGEESVAPTAPESYGVQIIGDARVGNTLKGDYIYTDINGDIESGSTYRWLLSDTLYGQYTAIEGETSIYYTVTESVYSKYLKFEVTPRTTVEPMQGATVQSLPFMVYRSSNANLAYLKYNGITIFEFNQNRTTYDIVLPGGTTRVPTITAKSEDSRATVHISNALNLPGTTTITVTAEDGITKIYTVSFSVEQSIIESTHNYENNLDYTWTYTLPGQYTALLVTFSQSTEVEDGYDFIHITDINDIPIPGSPFTGKELMGRQIKVPGNTIKIRLTSDSDENRYGFAVLDIKPELSLTSIKVNGVDIAEFKPSILNYRYILTGGVSNVPTVTVQGEEGAVYEIVPAASIPGDTEIKILDNQGNLIKIYKIEFRYQGDIELGDYVQFGRYNDEPIQWRVINKNEDGSLFLLSEKILALKPFDANGNVTQENADQERINFGSNNWETSNLREWLNSEKETVNYTYQPPDDGHVFNGYNNYENEAGFLYNFTQAERDAIQPVTHKSILSTADSSINDGGTELHIWNSNISSIVQNFDNAYFKNVTDKVFLLDVKELHDYLYARGYDYKRKLTVAAAANSEYKLNTEYWYYWLRTPASDNSYLQRFIYDEKEGYDFIYAYDGKIGVLPALNLKAEITPNSGDGSKYKPYIIGEKPTIVLDNPSRVTDISYSRSSVLNAYSNIPVNWSVNVYNNYNNVVASYVYNNSTQFNQVWAPTDKYQSSGKYTVICAATDMDGNSAGQVIQDVDVYNYPIKITQVLIQDALGQPISDITKGQTYQIEAKIENLGPEIESPMLIVQTKDANGYVINIGSTKLSNFTSGSTVSLTLGGTIPEWVASGDCSVDVMVWSGWESAAILSKAFSNSSAFTVV